MKTSRVLILVSTAVSAVIAVIIGMNIWHERQQTVEEARNRLTTLNYALAEQLERSLQAVDLAIGSVAHGLDTTSNWSSPEVHQLLRSYATVLPQIRALAVVDARGNIVNDSAQHPVSPINVADREHFKFLQANPHNRMFVSVPFKSRRDNEWTVVLSRRIVGSDGTFMGVVFARLQPSYFQELYKNVLRLPGSGVNVFRSDGILLLRQPHIEEVVGTSFLQAPLFASHLPQAEQGSFETTSVSDGASRLYSYTTLRAYPVVINSNQSMDAILAPWWTNAKRASIVVGLMLLAGFWLVRRLLLAMKAQEAADTSLRLAASVFEHTQEGILVTDARQHVIAINRAFTRLTGYTLADLEGKTPAVLRSGRHEPAFYQSMRRALQQSGEWRSEIWNVRKNGESFAGLLNISAVKDPAGTVTHYVAVYADITDLKKTQHHLEHLANFDALTSLPNRTLLTDRLDQAIARARRQKQLLAVCFLDLDSFKPINDQHGHEVGDLLLAQVAQRLRNAIRADDTAARLGGDEFVLLLSDLNTVEECEIALLRLIEDLAAPILVAGLSLRISASIGVAIYPFDDAEPDMLLRLADHAMYRAKENGRGRFHFFDAAEMAKEPDQG
ncbi:MAG: diguanylate cyclase [Gammaproteobacteria bacterium]|nr:diguanylate cyclase [Gammaproteobacteria bacterium]MBU1647534.1 diguanylate cyclase [Gammaproteobacteria bacterium]MBU1972983.1 diguanylate cyclase [Gammaproteobacteria bacterium]